MAKLIHGAGGNKGGRTPTTTPDTLISEDTVELMLGISEGQIKGLADGPRSFYVGGTPLLNLNGQPNFEKLSLGIHKGYSATDSSLKPVYPVLGGSANTTNVGVNLYQNSPVTRQTSPLYRGTIDQIEVRIMVNQLYFQNKDGVFEDRVEWRLEYKKASEMTWRYWNNVDPLGIYGKTTQGSVREVVIYLKGADRKIEDDDWQIRITKLSPDEESGNGEVHVREITWESFQVVDTQPRTYPDTAIVHLVATATGQFSSIPEFYGIYDGILCRVPSTGYNDADQAAPHYNSEVNPPTYNDDYRWAGEFKQAWTSNPAWILYDLLINERYGMRRYYPNLVVNVWDFYEAARFCDEPVPSGVEGQYQARYTFNGIIQDLRSGPEMLNYIASSFNGLLWDDGSGYIRLKVDKDDPATMLFTPENIQEGLFQYTRTDKTTWTNDISVTFVNPALNWETDKLRIVNITTDEAAIVRDGRIPLEFIAVGCTDANEAARKARYRLVTAQTEKLIVTFTTTKQGILLHPFDVILVADPDMGWAQTGRIKTMVGDTLTLRDPIHIETAYQTYEVKLQALKRSNVETAWEPYIYTILIGGLPIGSYDQFQFFIPNWELPLNDLIQIPDFTTFTLESNTDYGLAKPFRVVEVTEVDGSPYLYQIQALEINRNKYIESDALVDLPEVDYSYQEPAAPNVPQNFQAVTGHKYQLKTANGLVTRIYCTWRAPRINNVAEYEFQWREKDRTDWQSAKTTGLEFYAAPVQELQLYDLRVRSVDGRGRTSAWVTIADFRALGSQEPPSPVTAFSAEGQPYQIELRWLYAEDAIDLAMAVQIFVANTSNGLDFNNLPPPLVTLAYPNFQYVHKELLPDDHKYYWIRVQSKFYADDNSPIYSTFFGPVDAIATDHAAVTLPDLEGQIAFIHLNPTLQGQITLIEAPDTVPGSVDYRIAIEAAARGAQITDVQQAFATETAALATDIEGLTVSVAANTSAITSEATTRANADTAISTQVNLVQATANSKAKVWKQNDAPTGTDHALNDLWIDANDNNKLYAWNGSTWVLTADDRIAANAAAITTEQTTRANADTALSTQINNVSAIANAKTTTYRQTSAPTGGTYTLNDFWLDSDDGNKLYRWNGTAWEETSDTRISANAAAIQTEATTRATQDSALATSISTVQATANSKNRTYRQTSAPVGTFVDGDLWFDSDDNNKPYRWNGSTWVLAEDPRIAANTAAIATETTARADADTAMASQITTLSTSVATKNSVFHQNNAPSTTGRTTGDMWYDTDDNNKPYRFSSGSWISVEDPRVPANVAAIQSEATTRATQDTALATSITNVQAIADSKIKTYYQANQPSGTGYITGDLWFDTDDNNKPYRWSGAAWVALEDPRIPGNVAAIQTEATARANADSALSTSITSLTAKVDVKTTTYYQGTAPTGGTYTLNDFWINTNQYNQLHRWNGAYWEPTDDARIAINAAAIQSEATTRANEDSALASDISTVQAIANLKNAVWYGDNPPIWSQGIQNGDIWFDTNDGYRQYIWTGGAIGGWTDARDQGILASIATVQTQSNAIVNGTQAIAYAGTTVQATLDGHTTSIQEKLTSYTGNDGVTYAQKALNIDVNGRISGFKVEGNNTRTEAVWKVDSFAIGAVGVSSKYPFVVGTVGGVSSIGITGTLIVDGSITATKINSNGLTVRKNDGTLMMDTDGLDGVYIKAATIGGTSLADNTVTAGKINSNGLTVKKTDGTVMIDTTGVNGTYIHTASIGTLTLAGNAVSVITASEGGVVRGTGTSNYLTLTSANITNGGSETYTVVVDATFVVGYEGISGPVDQGFRVRRTVDAVTTTLVERPSLLQVNSDGWTFTDTIAAGKTHTYTLQWYAPAETSSPTTYTEVVSSSVILQMFKR